MPPLPWLTHLYNPLAQPRVLPLLEHLPRMDLHGIPALRRLVTSPRLLPRSPHRLRAAFLPPDPLRTRNRDLDPAARPSLRQWTRL